MDSTSMIAFGKIGGAMALGLSAVGSGIGSCVAASAAIGAWKKCYAQNRPALFILVVFIGAPLSQTIYGMIVMNKIVAAAEAAAGANFMVMLGAGFFGGLAIGLSAWFQGIAGAAASDAQAETGQGFGNYLMALGIIETVAIMTLVFLMKVIS